MSTATSSGQSMRQQLDDLDALLQRMLALPINQIDETPPPVPPRPEGAPKPTTPLTRAETPPPAPPAAPPSVPPAHSPPRMRLLTDSSPVPPPPEAEPVGYERTFTINLNPQQGS